MNTVFAAALCEGDWFWHEPCPGHRVAHLQAATFLVSDTSVLVCTTDGERELVAYGLDRPSSLPRGTKLGRLYYPAYATILATLPSTKVGKVDKPTLRARLQPLLAADGPRAR